MAVNDYTVLGTDYARETVSGTKYLAFRDVPALIEAYAPGRRTLDFGCGSGKSSRFLKEAGCDVVGVDIAAEQVALAREIDPSGDYRLLEPGTLPVEAGSFDLVFSSLVFLEMNSIAMMTEAMRSVRAALKPEGVFLMVTCADDFYRHDWLSYDVDFPENKDPRPGDTVRVTFLDVGLELTDYYWRDVDYTQAFEAAGFTIAERRWPLGHADEPYAWKDELHHSPMLYYVARPV